VFSTCRAAKLRIKDFKALFPSGYLRGACRLAGITYRDRFVNYFGEAGPEAGASVPGAEAAARAAPGSRTYAVDLFGFLTDPAAWNEEWAAHKARELKLAGGLNATHWQVLRTLRDRFNETGAVPTVTECCELNGLELEELELLFPGGYHREAVKLAGLCVTP
jgi:tRNA 2-thiouridine synthesizing protein E